MMKMMNNWHFNKNLNVYQCVNNEVYVYISEMLFGLKLQLYLRGNVSFCELEVQTSGKSIEKFKTLVNLGEEWLDKYGDDISKLNEDFYSIHNMNGCWNKDRELKRWLISG